MVVFVKVINVKIWVYLVLDYVCFMCKFFGFSFWDFGWELGGFVGEGGLILVGKGGKVRC